MAICGEKKMKSGKPRKCGIHERRQIQKLHDGRHRQRAYTKFSPHQQFYLTLNNCFIIVFSVYTVVRLSY